MIRVDLDQYLAELKYLCSLDTGKFYRPGVDAADTFFEEKFRDLGLTVERVYDGSEEYAPMVVAHNCDGTSFDVMLVAHLDTVFPVGTAAERPMTVDEHGIARGPGVEDCKSGALSIYYIAKALIEQKTSSVRFCIILNSDEEVGSTHSVDYISFIAKKSKYCFVFEPGRANGDYVIRRRGTVFYKLRFHGIASHSGSAPEKGANAVTELSHWVLALEKLSDPARGISVNCAVCSGGSGALNIVPDYAELSVSFRYFDQESLEKIHNAIVQRMKEPFNCNIQVEMERSGGRMGMTPSAETEKLMERMVETGKKMGLSFGFTSSGGGSDANEASMFIPTICACGPNGFCAHTIEEYIKVDSIQPRINLIYNLLEDMFPI